MNTATAAVPAAATPETLLESLRGRYAVKKFDPAGRIPAPIWQALQQALVLAPSSYGLQPWKFFVVADPALRAKLRAVSWGQSQITDADKLVVLAARRGFGAPDVERHLDRMAEVQGAPKASLEGARKMLLGAVARPQSDIDSWVAKQVYIALGTLLTSAAALGVDACPMEGFDKASYDELLGLEAKGYAAQVVAALGCRAEDDRYALSPKVRFPQAEVVEILA